MDSGWIRHARLGQANGDPTHIAYEGQQVLLYPTPQSSDDELHILYVPRPTSALVGTTDSPATTAYGGIPEEYHPALESYVKWKGSQHSNDQATGNGQSFQQEWETAIMEAIVSESRRAGLKRGGVQIGRGPDWRRLAGPGVDLGY